jgi:phosphate transport system protein
MPRNSYRDRLRALRGQVGAMGDRVLDQYRSATGVLETGDPRDTAAVIEGDESLNEWYLDIESECVELLALQQPVAGDLRFIASSFKIVTDLERIGDLATNLAAYGRDSGGEPAGPLEVAPIATTAGEMIETAIDAYGREDADLARETASRDDDLDRQCKQASDALVRYLLTDRPGGEQGPDLEHVSRTLLTIRDLERVGDHAVNVCARTVYMVEHEERLLY